MRVFISDLDSVRPLLRCRRYVLCWLLLLSVPGSLLGQTPAAILHTQGGVWLNQYEAKDASAVFAGDLLETKTGFTAQLTLDGSSVMIQSESLGKFQADLFELDHGSVSVTTVKNFKVQVKCLVVVPVASVPTQYDVTDVNGTIQVAAHKGDVNVERHQRDSDKTATAQAGGDASVHEGEQKNYNESELCGLPPREPSGRGLNPKWIGAGAAGAGVLIWVLIHGGGGSTPPDMSQSKP